jgi:hypothetical protein
MNPDLTTSTAPCIDTFNPASIVDPALSYVCKTSGFAIWRFIKAPASGGPHTLKFRCATRWSAQIPGGSFDASTGWVTMTFEDGDEMRDVQVTEILKAGSSAGVWVVAP